MPCEWSNWGWFLSPASITMETGAPSQTGLSVYKSPDIWDCLAHTFPGTLSSRPAHPCFATEVEIPGRRNLNAGHVRHGPGAVTTVNPCKGIKPGASGPVPSRCFGGSSWGSVGHLPELPAHVQAGVVMAPSRALRPRAEAGFPCFHEATVTHQHSLRKHDESVQASLW